MKVTAELDRRFRDAAAAAGDLDVGVRHGRDADRRDLRRGDAGGPVPHLVRPGARAPRREPRAHGRRARAALAAVGGRRRAGSSTSTSSTRRTDFDLAIDLRVAEGFSRRVLDELARVPYGEVTTYGELARRAEHPRAARAVGTVMNRNPIPIVLPCHRVVGSSGSLTGYAGGLERKEALLRLEGALL